MVAKFLRLVGWVEQGDTHAVLACLPVDPPRSPCGPVFAVNPLRFGLLWGVWRRLRIVN
jgi:hypothetical protein